MTQDQQPVSTSCSDQFDSDPSAFIDNMEVELLKLDQVDCPVTHRFTKGMYIREIFIPKGTLLTSMEHKTQHPFVVSQGCIAVVSQNEDRVVYTAPHTGITEPNTRRMLYAVEDTVWTTFHVTDKTDPDEVGEDILSIGANKLLDKNLPHLNQWRQTQLTIK